MTLYSVITALPFSSYPFEDGIKCSCTYAYGYDKALNEFTYM